MKRNTAVGTNITNIFVFKINHTGKKHYITMLKINRVIGIIMQFYCLNFNLVYFFGKLKFFSPEIMFLVRSKQKLFISKRKCVLNDLFKKKIFSATYFIAKLKYIQRAIKSSI